MRYRNGYAENGYDGGKNNAIGAGIGGNGTGVHVGGAGAGTAW